MEVEQSKSSDLLSAMTAEKIDQAVSCGDIGAYRVRRSAAIMAEKAGPSRSERPSRMVILV